MFVAAGFAVSITGVAGPGVGAFRVEMDDAKVPFPAARDFDARLLGKEGVNAPKAAPYLSGSLDCCDMLKITAHVLSSSHISA